MSLFFLAALGVSLSPAGVSLIFLGLPFLFFGVTSGVTFSSSDSSGSGVIGTSGSAADIFSSGSVAVADSESWESFSCPFSTAGDLSSPFLGVLSLCLAVCNVVRRACSVLCETKNMKCAASVTT